MAQEVDYYAQYLVFIQSLEQGKAVCEMDQRVADVYFPQVLTYYRQLDPKGFAKIMAKVKGKGVNTSEVQLSIERLNAAQGQQAHMEAMMQRAAAQDTTSPQGGSNDGGGGDPRQSEAAMMALQGLAGGAQDEERNQ